MRFHSQNLNEKKHGRTGWMLRHGRCWLSLGAFSFRLEWLIPTHFFCLGVEFADGDDAISFSFGCGLFVLFLGIGHSPLHRWLSKKIGGYEGREIKLTIHDGALWWSFWCPTMSWSSQTPRYRSGAFHPVDFLLGRAKYASRNIADERAVVPMPEGGYPASVKINEDTWKRPRWPFTKRIIRAEIRPDTPIPFPGKGENLYDCGEDASHSLYGCFDNTLDAVLGMSRSVMRSRLKYGGGWNYQPEKKTA